MPGFDDKLTRELERAARPAAPDVVRTFEDVARRRAHRVVVRKVQVVAVVVAVLAGTAGAFLLLDDRFADRQPVSSETVAPPVQQMSAWRLQVRPVMAIGTTGRDPSCAPKECTEDDLDPDADVALAARDGQVYELGPVIVDASNVVAAEAASIVGTGGEAAQWVVVIQIDEEGQAAFTSATERAWTAASPQNQIAVALDGEVIQAPTVQEPISSDSIQIGGLNEVDAKSLAAELSRSAPSPVPPTGPPDVPPVVKGDIGNGIRLCEFTESPGLSLSTDGPTGMVWVGSTASTQGECPRNRVPDWIVAADVTGDAQADVSWGPIEMCSWTMCVYLGALDLDGDGDVEVVIRDGFSHLSHLYFDVREGDGGELTLEPIRVAPPGNPAAGIEPGEPLMTGSAGDAGSAGWVRCEGYPDAPVIVFTSVSSIVESDEPAEWHETDLRMESDGRFHVVDTDAASLPPGEQPGWTLSSDPACGLDFDVWTPPNPEP